MIKILFCPSFDVAKVKLSKNSELWLDVALGIVCLNEVLYYLLQKSNYKSSTIAKNIVDTKQIHVFAELNNSKERK